MKAKMNFTFKDHFYEKEQELNPRDFDYKRILIMNEKGFIYPLTTKELFEIKKELENPIKIKKEDKYGNIN